MRQTEKKVRKRKRKRLVACLSLLNALVIVYTCILLDADPGFHNSSKKANPSLRLLFVLSASRQRHGQNFNYALLYESASLAKCLDQIQPTWSVGSS